MGSPPQISSKNSSKLQFQEEIATSKMPVMVKLPLGPIAKEYLAPVAQPGSTTTSTWFKAPTDEAGEHYYSEIRRGALLLRNRRCLVGPMGCVSPAAIWARGQVGFASEAEPESPYQRGGPAAYPIATKKENQFSLAAPLEQAAPLPKRQAKSVGRSRQELREEMLLARADREEILLARADRPLAGGRRFYLAS